MNENKQHYNRTGKQEDPSSQTGKDKIAIQKNVDGNINGLVTDRIEADKMLSEARDKYHNLFMELKDTIYESTPEGKFVELNPAGMEMFGIKSLDELKNIDIAKDIYINSDDRAKALSEFEKKGFIKDYEINIRRLTGEVLTVLETSMAVKDKDGKIISMRGILRDITERKKNEGKLKQLIERLEYVNNQLKESEEELKNTNASKDRFFSIIAHDLRSPFSSLLNFSEFLIEDIDELSKDEIKSFAGKINEAARIVFSLLENLLQWSRIQSGKMPYQPSSFNIFYKINQVITLLNNNSDNKKIKIINDVAANAIVFADNDMVFSVIQNLLSNAIKFTNEGGIIIIRSNSLENDIEISITDNGVGIKEEDLTKLFRIDIQYTTYGTRDEKGSGLGLILCKEMIERNRGKISVTSKHSEGTTFTFTLPKS
ncbi:MAG: PAS domain-containing sensor histidine kinase [Bacteroidota bacterium]